MFWEGNAQRKVGLTGPCQTFQGLTRAGPRASLPTFSVPMLATPPPEHTPPGLALSFHGRSSSGTQRAASGLEEMAGAASACQTSRGRLRNGGGP